MDRTFDTVDQDGNPIKLKLLVTNYELSRLCEIEYKKAWAFCLKEGVKIRQSLEEDLREAGVWTEKEETKIKDCETQCAIYIVLLNEALKNKNLDEAREAAVQISQLRSRAEDLLAIKQSAFAFSCEGTASEVRAEAFVAYGTVYDNEESKKYWSNYQDFTNRREEQAAQDALAKYIDLMVEENLTILKALPENKFFIEHGILDENLKPAKKQIIKKKATKKKKKKSTGKKKES